MTTLQTKDTIYCREILCSRKLLSRNRNKLFFDSSWEIKLVSFMG